MLLVAALVATGGLLAAPPGAASGHCDATVTPGDSIQAAVDAAAPGDRVCVEPGTYAEQVVVDKSLTLSGSDEPTIQAPGEMTTGPAGATAVVTVAGEEVDATLQRVNVAGPGPGACGSIDAGVAVVEGAHATVRSAEVTAIRDDPLSGCDGGVGVQVGPAVHADASTDGSAEIRSTTITDFQTSAVTVTGQGNEVTVAESTLTCSGADADGTVAQDAVQVRRSAATVLDSTIRDCAASVDGQDRGAAIHLSEGAHDVTVADSEIEDAHTAVAVDTYAGTEASPAPAKDVWIQGNWIEDNARGVDVAGPAHGVLVAGNAILGHDGVGVFVGPDDRIPDVAPSPDQEVTDVGIVDNQIHDNPGTGIRLADSANATDVHLNSFEGNDLAVENDDLAFVDARYNWWGSALGPTSDRNPHSASGVAGQPTEGYVEHRPFCAQPHCPLATALDAVSPV